MQAHQDSKNCTKSSLLYWAEQQKLIIGRMYVQLIMFYIMIVLYPNQSQTLQLQKVLCCQVIQRLCSCITCSHRPIGDRHTLYFSVCVTLMPDWGHFSGSFCGREERSAFTWLPIVLLYVCTVHGHLLNMFSHPNKVL